MSDKFEHVALFVSQYSLILSYLVLWVGVAVLWFFSNKAEKSILSERFSEQKVLLLFDTFV